MTATRLQKGATDDHPEDARRGAEETSAESKEEPGKLAQAEPADDKDLERQPGEEHNA